MSKKKPKEIEWLLSGNVTFSGATCIVKAATRAEAIAKANDGKGIEGVETNCAEMVDWEFESAEPNE